MLGSCYTATSAILNRWVRTGFKYHNHRWKRCRIAHTLGKGHGIYVNGDKVSKAVAMALDPEKIITVDVKKQDKAGVSTGQV